jgi:hypothetical protein
MHPLLSGEPHVPAMETRAVRISPEVSRRPPLHELLGRRPGGLLVVVDMCLALVFLGGILVRLVGMGQGGMVVLVVVVGGEVGPLLSMP